MTPREDHIKAAEKEESSHAQYFMMTVPTFGPDDRQEFGVHALLGTIPQARGLMWFEQPSAGSFHDLTTRRRIDVHLPPTL